MEITEQCDPGRQSPPRSRHLRPGPLIFICSLDDSVYAETAEAEQGTGHVIRERMLAHVALKVYIVSTEDIALHTQLEEGETQFWRFCCKQWKVAWEVWREGASRGVKEFTVSHGVSTSRY